MENAAYVNGAAFGRANLRGYGLRETLHVLACAARCDRTRVERLDWLRGFADAVLLEVSK